MRNILLLSGLVFVVGVWSSVGQQTGVPLSEIERLKVENMQLRLEQIDAQLALFVERKDRILHVEAPKLIDEARKAHDLDNSWTFDATAMQFVKKP